MSSGVVGVQVTQASAVRPTFRRQLVANGIGRVWGFLSNFVFVPMYLHILGVDNFGVIALFIAVAGIVAFLDLGLSPTLARELHDQTRSVQQRIDLLFSYEGVYAAIVGCVVLVALLVPAGAFSILLAPQDLARPEVAASVRLVFVCAAAQMLFNFYVSGLMGVEEQVQGNVVIVAGGLVRGALVIIPLWLYPQPLTYLVWQLVFVVAFALLARHLLYRAIDRDRTCSRREFSLGVISENLPFTGGMFLLALISAVIAQMDKLFIGKIEGMASLSEYSLASTFAQLLVFVISPVTITLLPRLVRNATSGNAEAVTSLFLFAHKLVAAIVCASVAGLVFFGPTLIGIWTGGNLDTTSIATYFAPLAIGYALVALQTIPHSIAVANKQLSGILLFGGVGAALTLPTYWYLIKSIGIPGAAVTWLCLQICLYPLYLRWVNRRFIGLKSLWWSLMVPSLLLPLAAALVISFCGSRLLSSTNHVLTNLAIAGGTALVSLFCCFAISLRRLDLHRALLSQRSDLP
jgi:O-antigen/teichoic acid export membrane protein